jgi:transcriptional regulator with XRE-family HTH domain
MIMRGYGVLGMEMQTQDDQTRKEALARRLKEQRERLGLSMHQVANNYSTETGKDPMTADLKGYIYKLEHAKVRPERDTLIAVARAYRFSPAEMNQLLVAANYLPEPTDDALDTVAFALRSAAEKISKEGREQVAAFVQKIQEKYQPKDKETLEQAEPVDVIMNVVSELIPDAPPESQAKVRQALEDMVSEGEKPM